MTIAMPGATRRLLLGAAAGALAARHATIAAAQTAPAISTDPARGRPPNLLFLFTDQQRVLPRLPTGLSLPAQERLARSGVTFNAHYCSAVMCTSSRAVMMTGLQTPDNGMFENTDVPWMRNLSTRIPTIGHMLRKAGYYTAYKGKWHLNDRFDSEEPDRLFTREMDEYGFSDYFSPGDIIGHTLGGYHFDHLVAGSAITWLRRHGQQLNAQGRPWALFVSLVNPHDIMYFNTDLPGQRVQDSGNLIMHAAPAPDHAAYRDHWDLPVPASMRQSFDAPGRPRAHAEFHRMWNYVLGEIPREEAPWRRFNDFYVNSIRAVDAQILRVLNEMDALGLTDRTAVALTSDHGEMGGAHGLHGKGPYAYRESVHIPFVLTHPDVRGGQDCRALTSHIDLVPSLIALAGASATDTATFAGRELPGKNMATLLANPGAAPANALHEGVLFTYSGLATNDSNLWKLVSEAQAQGRDPKAAMLRQRFAPDLRKRGSLRSVFDGRYRFTRYFSPRERNRPMDLDALYRDNDVELYDLEADPEEMVNLAADRGAHAPLVDAMRAKLERAIAVEIGVDDGREMPNIPLIDWSITRVDL
ncbi:sulfatase-like hydrolase/transferase [Roseomonas sp. AR75]|uniref:sulfatase-like hydrolase/transferase n=1 Tax=Roseomonas sp. AR75 TaxID=2562311 RepID=UPI0010BFBE8B|nr:sulfatase-like hydrolase/transferase [Roseomonas sp. AR75]